MQEKKIAILVILYNKKFEESDTLLSLVEFENTIDQLVIVNNGPYLLNEDDTLFKKLKKKHSAVHLKNYIENRPLSWIYNEFVDQYDADYYVFFDDDTKINKNTEKNIFKLENIDIELPKIIASSDLKQYYPIVNGEIFTSDGLINEYSEIYSIGSGLIFSKHVKEIFMEKNLELFDSRFALYGVDTSFFRKINYLKTKGIEFIVNSSISITHSLSRTEGEISEWRKIERLYDAIFSIKYYKNFKLLRLLKLCLKNKIKISNILWIFRTYRNGLHPRCVNRVRDF